MKDTPLPLSGPQARRWARVRRTPGEDVVVPRWWRSIRGRATLAFAGVVVVLSLTMVTGVWFSVSQYLLVQRERTTVAQAVANADRVQLGLRTAVAAPQLLSQLPREIGSTSLLVDRGQWFTTSLQIGRDALPAELREAVVGGQPSQQRISIGGRTMMAVGVPLAGLDDAYFEVFPLEELDRTYRVLSTGLATAGVAVPVLSLGLGWWAARPALRPLERLAAAAAAIAAGDLRTRIEARGDPELTSLAHSFNRTASALEHRVRADARFAADVAHELRTPLTTMAGAVDLVVGHRERLPEDGREGLDLLRAEVDRFERLVLDLLEISRIDAGSADLATEELRLADLVRWSLPAPLRSCLVVEPSAASVVVATDKRRVERVLVNLVENAQKHGGGLCAVTVSATSTDARVAIDDAGPGVDPGERERVFDRFARGRASTRTASEGAGLGLSLVARHLYLLGGSVSVTDSPQGGARFTVTLPLRSHSWAE